MPERTCSVDGCEGRAHCRGWCITHYSRWRKHGDVLADMPVAHKRAICTVDGCNLKHAAHGYCSAHYQRWKATGDPGCADVRGYRMERVATPSGYIRVWCPGHPMANTDGYALEHRKIVYDAGRPVGLGDHVHHLNGDKSDNRLENLEVLTPSAHLRGHIEQTGKVVNGYGVWPLLRDGQQIKRMVVFPTALYDLVRERAVVFAAAAWLMGLPVDRSDPVKMSRLVRQIEDVAAELSNEDTGEPLGFKPGWWKETAQ